MTFLEQLQAHKGGLIRLKTQLYWYKGHRWDNNPGRICLSLDAAAAAGSRTAATRTVAARRSAESSTAAAHLLIDGQPAWIWVAEQDIELLVNDQPIN
jgi:hypothetical protein